MPILRITYGDIEIFNGDVDVFQWDDTPGQSVTVTGRVKPKPASTGLLDLIANASRTRTQTAVAKHRQELAAADTEEDTDD